MTGVGAGGVSGVLTALAVDDEPGALLAKAPIDVAFLDVHMPGLDGVDLARVIGRIATPPVVVFVTAHDEYATVAFEVDAVDYLLKPVRTRRLDEALERVRRRMRRADGPAPPSADDARRRRLAIPAHGRILLVDREDVLFAEAQGDYVRLHTATDVHLVRMRLSRLAHQWEGDGFLRIHRSYLVSLAHVREVRVGDGTATVVVGDRELPVSRANLQTVHERLVSPHRIDRQCR